MSVTDLAIAESKNTFDKNYKLSYCLFFYNIKLILNSKMKACF